MKIDNFNIKKNVFIIAEIGNNHEGDLNLAKKMISLASQAGANAVKFQTIVPTKLVSVKQKDRIKQLERFQFSYDDFMVLSDYAKSENIMFLSTPFDIESCNFLNDIVPAFKIASGDNTFFPLIESIAKTGKPIIMSTGLMTLDEVNRSFSFIKDIWEKHDIKQHLALLHCVSSYPTDAENVNLSSMKELEKITKFIGYSDHASGIDACVLAIAFGAKIIEKHFTIDNNYSTFRDHQLSANPHDFKTMVDKIRVSEKMLGDGNKEPNKTELASKQSFRRSIVTKHNLSAGHRIELNDLSWVRPGGGLKPGDEYKVIGKILKFNIDSGTKIKMEDLE